jgi:signal transduction histidine kinase/ligand-binding sensor domain-containing protein
MIYKLILFLIPILSFGQSQFRFDHFSIKNGLSQNTVNCILKDKEGYYWFGTQDGLNRYDGYTMSIFRHDKSDSTSISDNFILSLLEDDFGNLWIGTRNGLNFFERKTAKFKKVIIHENEKKYFHNVIWELLKDKEGNILFSNIYGQFVKISLDPSGGNLFRTTVLRDSVSFIRTSDSTYCLLNFGKKSHACYSVSDSVENGFIRDVNIDNNIPLLEIGHDKLLLGTSVGLFIIKKDGSTFRENIIPDKTITRLYADRNENIWVGTTDGLYVFRKSDFTTKPTLLQHSGNDSYSIGSNNIQGIYEDPDGLIWIGTSEAGLSVFNPDKNVFSVFNQTTTIPLSSNSVYGIYQDQNEIWIATSEGVNHLVFANSLISDVYTNQIKLISSEVFTRTNAYPQSICDDFVTCITSDLEGNLWFGTNRGISVYHPTNNKWQHFNTKNSCLKSDVIFHLRCATDGKIWISTMDSFYSYDVTTQSFSSFLSANHPNGLFPSGYIFSTYEDSDESIWVSSTFGVYHINGKGEKIEFYFSDDEDATSLSYNMATSFLRDLKGRFWVSTLGGGIDLLDEKTNTFKSFTKTSGLINEVTYCLLEDANGRIWISTNAGLSCFDADNQIFTNYTEKDGLVANEFAQNACFKNSSGELFFGSPDGLIVFDPGKCITTSPVLPILLTSLKVNYIPVPFSSDSEIKLYYGDKTVSFEFAAPYFKNQEKIQYACLLEGFDNEWHGVLSSNRIVSYTNLPFGNYVFKVKLRMGNGGWQQRQLTMKIHIVTPIWMNPGFILTECLVFIAIVILLVRYYSQRKLRKNLQEIELQQKIYIERERISRDLHDNVGSSLTYISSSLNNIAFRIEKEEQKLSKEKLDTLSDFTRSTMQQLRETIWAINKENITVDELKNKINDYCGKMTDAANMHFKMDFSGNGDRILNPSLAINIYRIVQEAINNAVKHSNARLISVRIFDLDNRQLGIEISDNGRGMENSGTSTGYGMKNMSDRVTGLFGEFSVDSKKGKGTTIVIKVPVD